MISKRRGIRGSSTQQKLMSMGSKSVARLTLILRISTLLFAFASFLFLRKCKIECNEGDVTYKFGTYGYVLYTAVTAVFTAVYELLQIPLAIYKLKKDARMMEFLRKFDFYADGLISLLLGTGVATGFAVTKELTQIKVHLILTPKCMESAFSSFLKRVNGGTGLLLGAFICMIVLFVLSSANRNARNAPDENPTASLQF